MQPICLPEECITSWLDKLKCLAPGRGQFTAGGLAQQVCPTDWMQDESPQSTGRGDNLPPQDNLDEAERGKGTSPSPEETSAPAWLVERRDGNPRGRGNAAAGQFG